MANTARILKALRESGNSVLEHMQRQAYKPNERKKVMRRFSMTELSEIIGKSYTSLSKYESEGRIPAAETRNGRRIGYNLIDLQKIHDELGTGKRRPNNIKPTILGIANFKGGSSKSTLSVHFAHYLGIKGARILIIDADPQATTTTMFGLNPLNDGVPKEKTLYPFLSATREKKTLDYAVTKTNWPNIDLIPAALSLYAAEYELASNIKDNASTATRLQEMKREIQRLAANYDVVILDPPPALGMIAKAIMQSATCLIIPCQPTIPDFSSTVKYIETLAQMENDLREHGVTLEYDFIRILATRLTSDENQHQTIALMKSTFGSQMISTPFLQSAEITNAALMFMSVYELEKAMGSHRTYNRCIENLNAVCDEILALIQTEWTTNTLPDASTSLELRNVA